MWPLQGSCREGEFAVFYHIATADTSLFGTLWPVMALAPLKPINQSTSLLLLADQLAGEDRRTVHSASCLISFLFYLHLSALSAVANNFQLAQTTAKAVF